MILKRGIEICTSTWETSKFVIVTQKKKHLQVKPPINYVIKKLFKKLKWLALGII